jgi:hypothetical protein
MRADAQARAEEKTILAADRLLSAMTLLTRNDLDQRLGVHQAGEFRVEVERPEPTLYRIALAESTAPQVEILVTLVYRAEVRP